ncbi:MAG TPA: mechanosensitive ion channel domain-containing protein [Acidobacteriaceae bacterium]|nr:mechanosensitive ion channel domain-containing protein [Acidobacteriaceae bacterium]
MSPRIFSRTRYVLIAALSSTLILCLIISWTTRGVVSNAAGLHQANADGSTIVDVGPWETAQALSSLAVTAEEQDYARQAEHLADHDVDQAFAAALRSAQLQMRHAPLSGKTLAIQQRIAQLKQEVLQDQAAVDRSKSAAGPGPKPSGGVAPLSPTAVDLEVAEAQLGLDKDELSDAQRDLAHETGDLSVRIQQELAAREASMRQYDSQQQSGAGQIAVVSAETHGTLASRIHAWLNQRSRHAMLAQAQAQTENDVRTLTLDYNKIDTKMDHDSGAGMRGPLTLADLQDRSIQRQILSIIDDRIQTERQLAEVYEKWAAQVILQHRIVLHLILQSFEFILLIVLGMILGGAALRHLLAHPVLERRQAETLRTISEVVIQVIGVLLIVLVFFGPPKETTTMIGLTTAALTIALQDYIIAFLGWFFLVGKYGIRVGDLVEINGVSGEVAEVGLISTTLLETSGLMDKDVPTGRRISFLNGFAIRGQYFNFSTEGQWLRDEITINVPADLDIQSLAKQVEVMVSEEAGENARLAENEWKHASRAGRLSRLSAASTVNLRPSGSGIDIQVRYVTRAPERSEMRARLYRRVIELLHEKHRPAVPAAIG